MRFPRSSGILLHPTSLPGRSGIGDLGPAAYEFLDFLSAAGQKIWQVLPLGPMGFGDSPYQALSAFAGNPLLIDLEQLAEGGLLSRTDLDTAPEFPEDAADFDLVREFKLPLIAKAALEFENSAGPADRADLDDFSKRHASWLEDFALFMAVKIRQGGAAWSRWPRALAMRDPEAMDEARELLAGDIRTNRFAQFVFFRQWTRLRHACDERGIRLLGDVPIYVAHDSADVWASPELFELDADGNPLFVAGVPPDYFSETGQLWGNPTYRWDLLASRGYGWWLERLQATLGMVDMFRLDHFRGFEAYWAVPAAEPTAQNGQWVKGPGADFFEAAEGTLGRLPLIAENLGVITREVEELRTQFGYPGMAVLQFAFGNDPQAASFRPHNFPRELAAYTGTHDNDTTAGWWSESAQTGSTRTADEIKREREFARKYLGTEGSDISWVAIRTLLASVADVVLFPLQDVLGLGSEARMNLPGTAEGNWRWRFRRDMLTPDFASWLKQLAELYDR